MFLKSSRVVNPVIQGVCQVKGIQVSAKICEIVQGNWFELKRTYKICEKWMCGKLA